jgi:hypothetical protein
MKTNRIILSAGASRSGSTIVGVLIALVFIGVVVAAMLRNTGSQSSASVGYGVMQTMAATVASGIVATESYMGKPGDQGVLDLITKALNPATGSSNAPQPFLFNDNGEKVKIAGDQFFSSQLVVPDPAVPNAYFRVGSGKSKNKKDLKTALAFYDMTETVRITNSAKYNAHNAIYMRGGLQDGNNGMEVWGPATFEGIVKFQNVQSVFHNDAYFNKNVDIMRTPKFEDKTYFNENLNIQIGQGTFSMFDSAVGINGNLSTGNTNTTITVGNDVWFNGDFITPQGNAEINVKVVSDDPNNKFYYTDNIRMDKSAMGCNSCPSVGCVHNCVHPITQSTQITGFSNMDNTYKGSSIDNIPQKMGMKNPNLDDRRDPQLSLDNIPLSKMKTINDVKNAKKGNNNNCGNFSVECIEAKYAEAAAANELYEGHLVVKVTPGDYISNYFSNPAGTLNSKMILILDEGVTLGGRYFNTSPESSTLIYVGQKASLSQFNIDGAFHGLIYIDSLNTPPGAPCVTNYVNFGANSRIVGGIHSFTDCSLVWNTGAGGAAPPVIKFDPDILNNYATLVKGSSESTRTAEYADSTHQRVLLKGVGYYFY